MEELEMVLGMAWGGLNIIFKKTHSPNKQSQLLNILRDSFKISQDMHQGHSFQIRIYFSFVFTLRSFIRVAFVLVMSGKLIVDSVSMTSALLMWKHHKYHAFDFKSLNALMLNIEAIRGELCLKAHIKTFMLLCFAWVYVRFGTCHWGGPVCEIFWIIWLSLACQLAVILCTVKKSAC